MTKCKNCHCDCHCTEELHGHHYDGDLCTCDNCKCNNKRTYKKKTWNKRSLKIYRCPTEKQKKLKIELMMVDNE